MTLVPALLLATLLFQTPRAPEVIPYYITDGKNVAGYDAGDRALAVFALEAWARESGGRLRFTSTESESDALLIVRWVAAGEGLFGEMQRVQVNGKLRAVVNVSPGVAGLGEPFASRAAKDRLYRDTIVYLTCVHETGHALGLSHTSNFEDIMYYFGYGGDLGAYFQRYRDKLKSRADIPKFSGVSANDISVLKKLH